MKSRTPLVVVATVICLFCLGQAPLAQSLKVKGTFVDVCSGGPACTGTITQGGILNGTTVTVFTGGPQPTPDPTTFSFTQDLTITTIQGQLTVRGVNLFNVATGVASGFGRIDPDTSTGRFAGATGVLFLTGTTVSDSPFTIELHISGEITLAN